MHKVKFNFMEIGLKISPISPILIKSGGISANPSLPDMQFVRTYISGKGETIYIPGSSIKGVIRSYSENLLRTFNKNVCNVFKKDGLCVPENIENPYFIYQRACPICKTFGNTKLKGRTNFKDAYPEGNLKTETRYGVAISRLTHSVAAGPFDMELVVEANFKTKITIENFQVWQVGLILYCIEQMDDGWIKIGYGKNRGLGEVSAEIETLRMDFASKNQSDGEIWGIAEFLSENERENYGLKPGDKILLNIGESKDNGIFKTYRITSERIKSVSNEFIRKLKEFINE